MCQSTFSGAWQLVNFANSVTGPMELHLRCYENADDDVNAETELGN